MLYGFITMHGQQNLKLFVVLYQGIVTHYSLASGVKRMELEVNP
jgi:hypothetical protein